MEISILLGKIWGGLLVISGLAGVLWPRVFVRLYKDYRYNFLVGGVLLVLGLVTVVLHNLWVADWRVVITILGWFSLILGILQIALAKWITQEFQKTAQEEITKTNILSSIIELLIGAGLIAWLILGA
ncbi:hypothetical protein M1O57_04850 [Dehalococcoidia bacterium]|nr:hypothetical protein [Dehalococcoidia bacterium]MCL0056842.1 hypothetical protein [Dehalococcoidia bacterium]MCL0058378.1 hypothetical protein [Dehalococcoidia bacterium]MCL0073228.1 hypothetical protein [Dehalococcoidia bacterium]MCL0104898.1 hypothetical protein [Dehalococcoidia bacterium]